MKKLNNKGFAISGIMYSLLILIILLMFLALGVLANRRLTITKVIKDANDEIDNRDYAYMEHCFITPEDPYCYYAPTGRTRYVKIYAGKYRLEVWGAYGGSGSNPHGKKSLGGAGGYSVGTLNMLNQSEANLYIWVGVAPGQTIWSNTVTLSPAGFNFGGRGYTPGAHMSSQVPGASGGGGTDIRINKNNVNARIIVAGGGGGVGAQNQNNLRPGGHGGGVMASAGMCHNKNAGNFQLGSLIAPGATSDDQSRVNNINSIIGNNNGINAGFNRGAGVAPGVTSLDYTSSSLAGGGGGWYGGGAGLSGCSAAGGSGWVYTEQFYEVWRNRNSSVQDLMLDSAPYLSDSYVCRCNVSGENVTALFNCTDNNRCWNGNESPLSNPSQPNTSALRDGINLSNVWKNNPSWPSNWQTKTNPSLNELGGYARITSCKIIMKDEDTGVETAWILRDATRCPNYANDVLKTSCKGNAAAENSCTVSVAVTGSSPVETNQWITYTCSTTDGTC